MNTVKKFLDATGFNRGDNYPSIKTLCFKMIELGVETHTMIDVISFFLYDGESITELLNELSDMEFKLTQKYQSEKTVENWEKLLSIRNEGGIIELLLERLNTL